MSLFTVDKSAQEQTAEPLSNGTRWVGRDEKGRVLPGSQLGRGRPEGARAKLEHAFLDALYTSWTERGAEAIGRMIDEKPNEYVRVVASLLPREARISVDPLDDLTEEQLVSRIRDIYARVVAALGVDAALGRIGAEAGAEQALPLSTLQ